MEISRMLVNWNNYKMMVPFQFQDILGKENYEHISDVQFLTQLYILPYSLSCIHRLSNHRELF